MLRFHRDLPSFSPTALIPPTPTKFLSHCSDSTETYQVSLPLLRHLPSFSPTAPTPTKFLSHSPDSTDTYQVSLPLPRFHRDLPSFYPTALIPPRPTKFLSHCSDSTDTYQVSLPLLVVHVEPCSEVGFQSFLLTALTVDLPVFVL